MGQSSPGWRTRWLGTILCALVLLEGCATGTRVKAPSTVSTGNLQRARVFLAAGDYRRAVEACQDEVREQPSAASYVYLTYVYQAIQGFLDHSAARDDWGAIERLVRNMNGDKPELLIDPPEVLARMAKELIGEGVQRQSDVASAMAARLDQAATAGLWQQQRAWREAHRDSWWYGIPEEWGW